MHVDLSPNPENEVSAFELLDEQEQTRANAFLSRDSRCQFILCRAALRANLCTQHNLDNSELKIYADRNEKPTATVGGQSVLIQFNVSHSIDHGLLAFARHGRIGVDIENPSRRPNIDEILYSVFSSKEQVLLKHTPARNKRQLFFRLWTFKEALIKATGEGFRRDTTAFSIPDSLLGQDRVASMKLSDIPNVEWKIINLESDHFAAAAAYELVQS